MLYRNHENLNRFKETTFVFTRSINMWEVEEGDIYNENYHCFKGGTQALLDLGWIEPEIYID